MNFWHDSRLLNRGANAIFAAVMAALIAGVSWMVSQLPVFTLRSVEIEPVAVASAPLPLPAVLDNEPSLRHVALPILRATARDQVRGNFFTIDLDQVRQVFESVPWVRKATVRRVWPDGLVVGIEEHRPYALWGDGRLINTFGEIYSANIGEIEEYGPLAELSGPQGTERVLVQRHRELMQWLSPLDLKPVSVSLSARHAWSAELDDGSKLLLGREDGLPIADRVLRWVAAHPRIEARLSGAAELIDLRYQNGFAIRAVALLDEDGEPVGASPKNAPGRRSGTKR